jgi:hypothetical protein
MTEAVQLPNEGNATAGSGTRARVTRGLRHWHLTPTFAWLSNTLLSLIPVGYEDETGFHRGQAPEPSPL